jgi:hypothetical protein
MRLLILIISTLSFQSLASELKYDVADLGTTKYISVSSPEDTSNYSIIFYFNCDVSSPYASSPYYTRVDQLHSYAIDFSAVNNLDGKVKIGRYRENIESPEEWDAYMKSSKKILLVGEDQSRFQEVTKTKEIPLDGIYYRYNRYIKDDCLEEYKKGIQETKEEEERDTLTYKIKNLFG